MNLGILCPSEIAYRRFLPALADIDTVHFIGVAVNSVTERYGSNIPNSSEVQSMLIRGKNKASLMIKEYGGKIYDSYAEIIEDKSIDALYIPLPPALHYHWAKEALAFGKHILVEKPFTASLNDTLTLVEEAKTHNLAIHENYMFLFHKQVQVIKQLIDSGELGDIRQYRISFGFPRRQATDFRYNKALGGGALLDAGGYTIKYANWLLGGNAKVEYAKLNRISDFDVDLFGSGVLANEEGTTVQIAFGMDNEYKCELEVWGSKGTLSTGRILTAPTGFVPQANLKIENKESVMNLPSDNAFRNSILHFIKCIEDPAYRTENYNAIKRQAILVNEFVERAKKS